ncbi:hypothetical protein [Vitiosangium sp. GDMCC 1.1324]|uniref:hypothetical protein n=1 Tax=Vitiosangium sp. (strain GDMCC 1.1324) TaxID=2138576 RepID=UPI000D33B20C|nr:hypothetical protein [Vitiosangium sp. GDMCC 1.1324]PTL84238.1 hypothetical protein DAT35_12465 [Vitiosangium sp. GDMCC 1.1324]
MRTLPRVLLLTATTLLTSGCRKLADTFFVVNAETEEICKTERSISFPAATPDTRALTHTFEFPLGEIGADLPEGRLATDFRLRLFELAVTEGGADLSTLEYAKVSLRRTGSTEIIRTLLEYQQPTEAFSPTSITLRGVEAASVPQLARDDRLELVLEARGTLPPQAWTGDIRACAGLSAEVHYFDFIF